MPTYTFVNKDDETQFTTVISVKERGEFLENNPNYYQLVSVSNFVSSNGGIKTDEGFKDILRSIKKSNKGSTIDV